MTRADIATKQYRINEEITQIHLKTIQARASIRSIAVISAKDESKRPQLVFFPGIGGWAEQFLPTMKLLAEQGYSSIAADLPGFGKSTFSAVELTGDLITAIMAKWIVVNELDQINLVGNSLGGGTAIGVWSFLKKKIRSLILAAPAGFERNVWIGYRIAALPIIRELLILLGYNPIWGYHLGRSRKSWDSVVYDVASIPDIFLIEKGLLQSDLKNGKGYMGVLKRSITITGIKSTITETIQRIARKIGESDTPVQVIWGLEDTILPIDSILHVRRLIPHARIRILDKCGHLPFIEKPKEFTREVALFLKDLE